MNPRPIMTADAAAELAVLENAVIDHLFELQPGYAVFLGLHQYDGRLPLWTRESTEAWAAAADRHLEKLRALPEGPLPAERRLDRMMLTLLLESALFDIRDSREYDRNPMGALGAVSLTSYMVRDYAPLSRRVDAIIRALEEVPRFLSSARTRLDPVLPEPFVRLALSIGSGLPGHYAEAEEMVRRSSASLGDALHAARVPAEAAVGEMLGALRSEFAPRATPDFALGPERYQKLLWVREGVRTPFAQVADAGWADLRRNQARLQALADAAKPPRSPTVLLEEMYRDHPGAETLLEEARGFVESTLRFITDNGLVTVPRQASCRVEETPVYGRALSTASMNPPGPFEVSGDEGIYFITPPDAAWTPERREEWLRSLNRPMLRNITVHEVYPGHYLQFLHFRQSAQTPTRRVYLSSSFTEGWAHYCEQLAVEQGLGREDPRSEAAQIHDALLRDCRLLSSVGLHTGGMTLAESAALFQREAHMEPLPSEREAIRGTFNPEYFCYTLGKLAILEARERHRDAGLGDSSLRSFHDRLLSFGCPPVGLLDGLFDTPEIGAARPGRA